MARQLEEYVSFRQERVRYPWGEWANGKAWEVMGGEDFLCTPESFVSYIHRYARLNSMKVRTKTYADSFPVRVVFRFVKLKPRGAMYKMKRKVRDGC